MKVAILGPGAVGGFLAAVLSRARATVTCVGLEESVARIAQQGIRLVSKQFGNFTACPQAAAELNIEPEILFVTVKAPALNDALKRIQFPGSSETIVIPMLNGLDHMAVLKQRFRRVVAGSMGIEVYLGASGEIVHASSDARVALASDDQELKKKLPEIAGFLETAGIDVRLMPTEAEVLWRKLIRLAPLALTTAASGEPLGFILEDKDWRRRFENCLREALSLAAKEGVAVQFEQAMQEVGQIHPEQRSSLARDMARGKRGELDAVAGSLIKRAGLYGLPCPELKALWTMLDARANK